MFELFVLYFIVSGLIQTTVCQKAGLCPSKPKRDLCQCPPHGSDQCNDTCRSDNDCSGLSKCCYDNCNRICKLPEILHDLCPPGEEYQTCGPPHPQTCIQQNETPSECVSGCFCPIGYVRADDGRCIKPIQCPPLPQIRQPICAGRHEVYLPCQNCDRSCANQKADGCLATICVAGCYCAPGYVRNGLGRCISPTACPPSQKLLSPLPPAPICPKNQEYKSCKRICELTCTNPSGLGCLRKCQTGCFCRSPLVRDHNGNCVALENCPLAITQPPICVGENQIHLVCKNRCQATCDNPQGLECSRKCVSGCFCRESFVWHDNACIAEKDCPPPTPLRSPPPATPSWPICENELEEFKVCGCQKTCENPTGIACDKDHCVSGCYCRDDYVRHPEGHCIPVELCPNPPCGVHEVFEKCGPNCQETCIGKMDCVPKGVCVSGCYCAQGYVKNIRDNTCVSSAQCRMRRACPDGGPESFSCGQVCQMQCLNGYSTSSCPSSCRHRCCRKRRRRLRL